MGEDCPVGVVAREPLADGQDFDSADAHEGLAEVAVVLGRLDGHRQIRVRGPGRDVDLDFEGDR